MSGRQIAEKCVAFLACLVAFAPLTAAAGCTLGLATPLTLTIDGPRLYVPVSMNGRQGSFLVDTGSQGTLLTAAFAAAASVGLDHHAGQIVYNGAGGRETLRLNQAHARRIEVGKIAFQDWEFPVLPAEAGDRGYAMHSGLLGMDFLHYFDIDVDLRNHTLNLWRVTGCKDIQPTAWQGDYDAIPLKHTAHQNVTMPIFIDNAFLDVTFDTGAAGLLLTRDAGARGGATDAALATDRLRHGTGLGGAFPSVAHRFNLLLVGKAVFNNPNIAVQSDNMQTHYDDGLMGWRYLNANRFWISYATSTLFVQEEKK